MACSCDVAATKNKYEYVCRVFLDFLKLVYISLLPSCQQTKDTAHIGHHIVNNIYTLHSQNIPQC